MVSTQTPICDFNTPAIDFNLKGVDGKMHNLTSCKGKNPKVTIIAYFFVKYTLFLFE
jgi:peroxiredoxin